MTWRLTELTRLRVAMVAALALSSAVSVDVPGSTDPKKFAEDAAAAKKVTNGWELPRHTFRRVLTYDDNLGNWLQSGATMAMRDRVILIPEVSDRHGMLWHKEPINTSSFQLRFQMMLNLTEKHKQQDPFLLSRSSYLTFWMSPDNLLEDYSEEKIVKSENWSTGLEALGLSFFGNKPTFRGLMLSFVQASGTGTPVQGVKVGWNTGADYTGNAIAHELETFTPIDWKAMPYVELNIRVQLPNVLTVILTDPTAATNLPKTIFTLGPEHGPVTGWDGTYFGFTAFSGSDKPAEANVRIVEAVNFDKTRVGEEASTRTSDVMAIEAWEDMLRREKRYINQRSQTEALEKLTELLEQHVDHMSELGGEVQAKFVELGSRLDMMETHLGQTLAGLEAFNVDAGKMDINTVNQHVMGLKQAFVKLGRLHDGAVHKMQEATLKLKPELANPTQKKERQVMVKAAAQQVEQLEDQVSKSSVQTGWMMLCLMVCVSGLGFLFLRRMHYYEKKHFI